MENETSYIHSTRYLLYNGQNCLKLMISLIGEYKPVHRKEIFYLDVIIDLYVCVFFYQNFGKRSKIENMEKE